MVIFTHHSPTADDRATNPEHKYSELASGFRTDLSQEKCWTSKVVKLWAFGYTHWSCDYMDGEKRVYATRLAIHMSSWGVMTKRR